MTLHMANTALDMLPNPEQEDQYIEDHFGITPELIKELGKTYWEIRTIALEAQTKKNPSQYEVAVRDLLVKIAETIRLNESKDPAQKPQLAEGLPLKVAMMIYPEFKDHFQYIQWVNEEEEALNKASAKYPKAPERGTKVDNGDREYIQKILAKQVRNDEKERRDYEAWVDEIEGKKPESEEQEVITSVRQSLEELLSADETEELKDEDIEYVEEQPETQRKAS